MKLLVLQGLPACGKSTYAKELVNSDTSYVRVCRDDLRHMRGIYWLPDQENMITDWEKECVCIGLTYKRNVIVDATNLNPKCIKTWTLIAQQFNAELEIKFFDVPLAECIYRDGLRNEPVGEQVITRMYNQYLRDKVVFKPIVQDKSLPKCAIFDIDGTLALHNGRNPFDLQRCDSDLVNTPVQTMAHNYLTPGGTKTIFIFSGREDSCKDKTAVWLSNKAGIYTNNLFMRKTGDTRSDDIVKWELFNAHIKDKYYVEFIVDDRPKVIRMWKKLGLFVFDVGDGIEF